MHRVVERCLIGVRTLSEPQKFDMIFLNSMLLMFWNSISYLSPFVDDFLRQYDWYGSSHILERWRHHDRFVIMPATTYGKVGCGVGLAHCYITIFLKSSGYRNIDDRHINPNINTREIIWLGNQLEQLGQGRIEQKYFILTNFVCSQTRRPISYNHTDRSPWICHNFHRKKRSWHEGQQPWFWSLALRYMCGVWGFGGNNNVLLRAGIPLQDVLWKGRWSVALWVLPP